MQINSFKISKLKSKFFDSKIEVSAALKIKSTRSKKAKIIFSINVTQKLHQLLFQDYQFDKEKMHILESKMAALHCRFCYYTADRTILKKAFVVIIQSSTSFWTLDSYVFSIYGTDDMRLVPHFLKLFRDR